MTELLTDMLKSEIFWKALGAILAGIWSLPAVQWFRRELREHRLAFLMDAARDVATEVYRGYRKDMLEGKKDPDAARAEAVQHLRRELKQRAPRLAGKLTQRQMERLVDDAFDELEQREARKDG